MKKINAFIKAACFSYIILLMFLAPGCASSQEEINSASSQPYNVADLNSYGEWINTNNYGSAWQPYAVVGWMPFDNGHWAYSNENWTWVSYEPFGWIVYHYGYWYDDPLYGWVWIPSDGIWSPANVSWFNDGDYIGWAPLGPRGVDYGNPFDRDHDKYWHIVRTEDFTRDNIRDFRIKNPVKNENSKEIIYKQPDRKSIEKLSGKPVNEVKMQHENVTLPPRQIQKMNLPPQEHQRVEQNSQRVRKEVLVPKEEFHRQQSERIKKEK
jgi:Family of unknown function (DUF6600)